MQRALIIALFAALAGCNQQTLLEKFATAEDQAFARQQIQLLKAGDYASIEKRADPSIKEPRPPGCVDEDGGPYSRRRPKSVELVGRKRLVLVTRSLPILLMSMSIPTSGF